MTFCRALRPIPILLLAACGLAGCGTNPLKAVTEAEPPPVLRLEVDAPRPLAALLRRHLDLAHVNRLAQGEALDDGEIERLVLAAPEQARALLATEGHFLAEVRAERLPGSPPVVRVVVDPGPQAEVRGVSLAVQGPLQEAADAGDPLARDARRALRADWPLGPGAPFRDEDWRSAKDRSMVQLRGQGWRAARWAATRATVDATRRGVELSASADSGPLHRTGELRIEGLVHHDEQTVRNVADFPPGSVATEELVLDFQERLQKTNLFERASVTLAASPEDPAATPVTVRLREQPLQDATLGVGVAANTGLRASAEHRHRRFLGRPWTARNLVELAQREQRWEGEVSTHTLPGLWRNLVAARLDRLVDDDRVVSAQLRLGRSQDTRRISRLVFAELQHSTRRSDLREERAQSVAGHYHGVWRDVDDELLPTRGEVWSGQAGLGLARSDPGTQGPFSRLYARLDAFRPLGGSWYGQARVELGQVFSRSDVLVPEALRFRAGGDESVRGYAWRSLAPQQDGEPVSGKVLFTTSVEVARPISERFPQLWGAAFVDAGRAAMRWRELDPAVGLGVGLRYRSPVGPVRLDLAWGEETRKARLHLTVGVTF